MLSVYESPCAGTRNCSSISYISVLSAYNSYLVTTGDRMPMKNFHCTLAYQLLEQYGTPASLTHGRHLLMQAQLDRLHCLAYMSRHYQKSTATNNPQDGHEPACWQCKVCWETTHCPKRRRMASYKCAECQLPLCIRECFREYHCWPPYTKLWHIKCM